MKTDLSFWKSKFPAIQVAPLNQLLYKKYIYKLVLKFPNTTAGIISHLMGRDRKVVLNKKRDYWIHKRYLALRQNDLKLADFVVNAAEMIEAMDCRTMGSWTSLSISTNDMDALQKFAMFIKRHSKYAKVDGISAPASQEACDVIKTGAVLKNSDPEFPYMVYLRCKTRRKYPPGHGDHILNHLQMLEDVKVPSGTRKSLQRNYFYNCPIYVKDPNNLSFLTLIDPDLVGRISPLVKNPDK